MYETMSSRLCATYLYYDTFSSSHTTGVSFRSGSFRKLGLPYIGVLVTRILLFRVLY